jgi:hypothetical protein
MSKLNPTIIKDRKENRIHMCKDFETLSLDESRHASKLPSTATVVQTLEIGGRELELFLTKHTLVAAAAFIAATLASV